MEKTAPVNSSLSFIHCNYKKILLCVYFCIVLGIMVFPLPVHSQQLINSFKTVPTQGALDWESFTIGEDTYLAMASLYPYNGTSIIYHWDGISFVVLQSIPTQGACDWESFTIDGDIFLAVANYYNGSSYNIDSRIYHWNGVSFVEIQSIPTQGARDLESFTINGDIYLAVANYYNGSSYNVDSKIFRWNGLSFVEAQSIPTQGAFGWESFSIDGDIFLSVANRHNGSSNNINSKIYHWNGVSFVEIQSIPTHGAIDWESFTIGGDTYLAVANYYNGSSHNVDSEILRKETPYARAGENRLSFDSVTLDGSASFDAAEGHIINWEWALLHKTNPDFNRVASGETVFVENLVPGFYSVILTVTDNDGFTDTDEIILSAIGKKGDFDRDGDVDGHDLSVFTENFGYNN